MYQTDKLMPEAIQPPTTATTTPHTIPQVHVSVLVFNSTGQVLLRRHNAEDAWATFSAPLRQDEYIHAAAARVSHDQLGVRTTAHSIVGCYHEPTTATAPNKIVFTATTALSSDEASQINLRDPDEHSQSTSWWEPHALLSAAGVDNTVKNYFSPTPWNKIM